MDPSVGVLLTLLRSARPVVVLFLITICVACGDTFRPVAIPIVPAPPSPAASHFVLVINGNGFGTIGNGTFNQGTSTRIDVSGDTNVGVAPLGLGPVHAALLPNSSQLYVANFLEDTVSSFAPTSIGPVTTTSLPSGSQPVFVNTTENGTVYVANSGTNTVAAISTANNVVMNFITVGALDTSGLIHSFSPNTLAETPDGKKVYAVGSDSSGVGWVVSINSADKTLNEATTGQTIPNVTTLPDAHIIAPAWAVARADSARVYVLNSGSGSVSVIDTTTDTVLNSVPAGPSVNCLGQPQACGFMLYDKTRTRLYVTNPASTKVVVLDASTDALNALASVDLTTAPNSVCGGGCFPVSIAVLPDGSRAYVASYQLGTDPITGKASISAGVTVFSTTANTITGTIALGSTDIDAANPTGCGPTVPPLSAPPMRFRLSAAASADGTRVYVSSCDLGSTSIIDTFPSTAKADSLGLELPASASDFQPSTVTVSAASPSGPNTTYNYTVSASLPPLRVGMKMVITGMTDAANNGTFSITAVDPKTFTVVNSGVAASGQNGTGIATTPQNPVFTLAGP
ncbi:MAG TPA: YncE family protein [Terriglobales bacterium]|jgi:YVTN family beta-propeller protein|nr:YncE family protein [Terriglobales bacterium]